MCAQIEHLGLQHKVECEIIAREWANCKMDSQTKHENHS